MRFLLKVTIPAESGNAAAKAGRLGETIQSILTDLKPEAAYFTDSDGQRAGFIFLEMRDASQIPAIAEPWFLAFNASIEIHPVMVPDALPKRAARSRRLSRHTPDSLRPTRRWSAAASDAEAAEAHMNCSRRRAGRRAARRHHQGGS